MAVQRGYFLTVLLPGALRRRPVNAVVIAETIRNFGLGLFTIFEPAYLYLLFRDLGSATPAVWPFFFYAGTFTLYSVLAVVSSRLVPRFGFRTLAIVSSLFLIVHYGALYLSRTEPWLLVLSGGALAVRMALFWPSYHIFFLRVTQSARRGTELSRLAVIAGVVGAISPAVGGIILRQFGFPVLFVLVFAFIVLSTVPYAVVNLRDGYFGGLHPILQDVRGGIRGAPAVSFIGHGLEESAAAYAWPLFLFLASFSYTQIGWITAVSLVAALGVSVIAGHVTDQHDRRVLLSLGAPFAALSWLMRTATISPATAFVANGVAGVARATMLIPYGAIFYDWLGAADPPRQVRRVLFHEVVLNGLGRNLFFFLSPQPRSFPAASCVGYCSPPSPQRS